MKTILLTSSLLLALGLASTTASAGTFTFTPYDANNDVKTDVFDLDHNSLYLWAIAPSSALTDALAAGDTITSATITINDIYNWDNNSYALKFYLLDNVKKNDLDSQVDIISIADGQSNTAANEIPFYDDSNPTLSKRKFMDYLHLNTISYTKGPGTTPNPIPGPSGPPVDISYTFDASELISLGDYLDTVNTWGSTTYNSTIGLGFDPDCHFYNDGISFVIETAPVPEPATMLLLGTGLTALAVRRKTRNSN